MLKRRPPGFVVKIVVVLGFCQAFLPLSVACMTPQGNDKDGNCSRYFAA